MNHVLYLINFLLFHKKILLEAMMSSGSWVVGLKVKIPSIIGEKALQPVVDAINKSLHISLSLGKRCVYLVMLG